MALWYPQCFASRLCHEDHHSNSPETRNRAAQVHQPHELSDRPRVEGGNMTAQKLCRCKAWIKIWWFPRVLKCLAWSNGVNDVHLCHRQAFWATGFHCFQTRKPWKIPDPDPDTPTSQLFGRSRASFKSTKPFKSNGTNKNYRNFITNQQLIYVHILF